MHPPVVPPRRGHARRSTVACALAVATLAACSGGGSGGAARLRTTATSGPQVLDEKVVAAPRTGDAATRFALADGTTVLVPVGALAKGAEVRVRRIAAEALGQGAMEGGPSAYEVSVSTGTIAKPVAVQVVVPDAPDRGAAVAVAWDPASGAWQPVNADVGSGTVTIYAARPGTYAWVRWSWAAAAAVGVETVRSFMGPAATDGAELACGSAADLATRFRPRTTATGALRWCAGATGGTDGLVVANQAAVPLALRQRGLADGSTTRRSRLAEAVADVVRRHAPAVDGESVDVLAPGERTTFRLTTGVEATAALAADGTAEYYQAIGTAAAFTVGLYAGTPQAAVAVLERNEAVRGALLSALDAPGCADALAPAAGSSRPAAEWADAVQRLTVRCVPDPVLRLVVEASARLSALRAAFASTTAAIPAASQALVTPALVAALEPVVAAEDGGDVTLVPVPPPPPPTTPAPGAPTTTTDAGPPAAPTTSTTLIIQTTTVATAPPVTTAAPGATTLPATTTTAAVPVPTLALVTDPPTCSDRGGTVTSAGTGFTPGGLLTVTYVSPGGARRAVGGTASTTGTFTVTFDCRAQQRGAWTVQARNTTTGVSTATLGFTVARNV